MVWDRLGFWGSHILGPPRQYLNFHKTFAVELHPTFINYPLIN